MKKNINLSLRTIKKHFDPKLAVIIIKIKPVPNCIS